MNEAFKAWVDRWEIGPGMNDNYKLTHINEQRVANGEEPIEPRTRYSGFDGSVGKGWVPILDRLAADLKAMGWNGSVQQIKEKFGTLRFYANTTGVPEDQYDAFWKRIHEAEAESGKTCEDCGAPGTHGPRPGRSWWLTLCDSCRGGPAE